MSTSPVLQEELNFPQKGGVTWDRLKGATLCEFCEALLFYNWHSRRHPWFNDMDGLVESIAVAHVIKNGELGCLFCNALRGTAAFSEVAKKERIEEGESNLGWSRRRTISLARYNRKRVTFLSGRAGLSQDDFPEFGLSIEPSTLVPLRFLGMLTRQHCT